MLRGFVKLKKIKKIREKLGSGWVGQVPTRTFFFHVVFLLYMFPKIKKMDRGVGGCCLANPSFSRIFLFLFLFFKLDKTPNKNALVCSYIFARDRY